MKAGNRILVFDFGNVLVDLDFNNLSNNFADIFGSNWSYDAFPKRIQDVVDRYQKGLISDDTFVWHFQQLKDNIDPARIVKAWMSLLVGLPMKRLDMLKELGRSYKLALLSNINNFHLNWIQGFLKHKYGIDDFEDRFFDKVYYSHLINLIKPDPAIFEFVESDMGVEAKDILFIDDREENIEAAGTRGWNTQWHDPDTEIVEQISHYLKTNSF